MAGRVCLRLSGALPCSCQLMRAWPYHPCAAVHAPAACTALQPRASFWSADSYPCTNTELSAVIINIWPRKWFTYNSWMVMTPSLVQSVSRHAQGIGHQQSASKNRCDFLAPIFIFSYMPGCPCQDAKHGSIPSVMYVFQHSMHDFLVTETCAGLLPWDWRLRPHANRACAFSHLQKRSLSGALMYAQNAVRALSTSLRATRSLL